MSSENWENEEYGCIRNKYLNTYLLTYNGTCIKEAALVQNIRQSLGCGGLEFYHGNTGR